jgi:hypothetical protein
MIWHVVLISLVTGGTVFTLPLSSGFTDQQAQAACSKDYGVEINTFLRAHLSTTFIHLGTRIVKPACQKF